MTHNTIGVFIRNLHRQTSISLIGYVLGKYFALCTRIRHIWISNLAYHCMTMGQ